MESKRLRRSVPLKVLAHLVMACATAIFVACLLLFIMAMGTRISSSAASGNAKDMQNAYFSSNLFINEYGVTMDSLLNGLGRIERSDSGYPLEAYITNKVNFKYAVYDRNGKIMYSSKDWKDENFNVTDKKYYYIVDINSLEKFDHIQNIRIVKFTESPLDAAGEEIQPGGNEISGTIVYSSNFVQYTSFYDAAETEYADTVGYICTYVPEELSPGDSFYDSYTYFQKWTGAGKWSVIGMGISFLGIAICFTYLMISAGYGYKEEGVHLNGFDKIYTEIAAAIIIMAVTLLISFAYTGSTSLYRQEALIMDSVCFIFPAYVVGVAGVLSFARRFKCGTIIKNSLVYKIVYGLYDVIARGIIKNDILRKYVIVVFAMGLGDLVLMAMAGSSGSAVLWFFVFCIYLYEFVYIGKKLLAIQDIKRGAQKIASGDLDYKINTEKMGGIFKSFAEDINNIGGGLNAAVDERTKSERMKADLITNVSHDIKTPLTSIINYVDLLKRENISQQPVKEYIEILETKSKRLKELTEDLVEASRASSGNITLEKNCINFVELAAQVAGTYQEKYDAKHLDIVFNSEDEKMMIMADGRRLYRVLDNLFNNAYKYSIEYSRVYVDMYRGVDKACFVMKNISKAPLNISAEELTQRFVRGDSSRSTEGSGLGLSIARSLTELHGGKFNIYLDGDLFKVMITMDLTKELN